MYIHEPLAELDFSRRYINALLLAGQLNTTELSVSAVIFIVDGTTEYVYTDAEFEAVELPVALFAIT